MFYRKHVFYRKHEPVSSKSVLIQFHIYWTAIDFDFGGGARQVSDLPEVQLLFTVSDR